MCSVVPFSSLVEHMKLMFVGVVELSRTYFCSMEKLYSLVSLSSLVEHIRLMSVGVVELSRAYFS